ncbi:MAG: TIGR03617 family F420-dependent LLM class oxidoreductase [Acidimicrobiia bacterium]
MKLDTILGGDLTTAAEVAKKAEDLGFSGLWTAEALNTPYLPHAVAALATERVDLGTAIAVAFPRSPMVHAMTAWDLHKASRGRFVLGLGTQIRKHNEHRFSVAYDRPGPRLRDMVLAIRHIWECFDGEHGLDYHGEFFTHDYIQPFFNPGPTGFGRPRIMIAAVGPYMCKTAGEVCDGIQIHPFHTTKFLDEHVMPNVDAGLAKAGKTRDGFEFATTTFVLTGDERQQDAMAAMARTQIAFYGSTPAYAKVFECEGWDGLQPQLQQLMRSRDMAKMSALITDEVLDRFCVRAPFDSLADAIRDKYEGKIDRLGFYMPIIGGGQEKEWGRVIEDLSR